MSVRDSTDELILTRGVNSIDELTLTKVETARPNVRLVLADLT
jgi:hypothetical protein